MSPDPVERAAAARARDAARARALRQFFVIAKRFHMTRDERLAYASQMLGRDVDTFKQLSGPEVVELSTGLRGAVFVFVLLGQRPRATGRAATRPRSAPGTSDG